jgi:hypothetical protein
LVTGGEIPKYLNVSVNGLAGLDGYPVGFTVSYPDDEGVLLIGGRESCPF